MRTIEIPGSGRPYLDGDSLDLGSPLVLTIPRVLAADECAATISRIDELGPTAAPVTTASGFVMMPDVRNNQRVMFDDVELAAQLYARVRDALPERLCGMRRVGINERFRCYRYAPRQRFAAHYDGAFVRDERERSLLTFMVYLNQDFVGGSTAFLDFMREIVPRTGMALVFQHLLLHEGCMVVEGVKYVLRTDVMYRGD
jgi:hypothetical protein